MAGPDLDFWQQRYATQQTGWDRGGPSPQLAAWLAGQTLTAPAHVVVPGCGAGWEVAELAGAGFTVTGLDYAAAALERARALMAQRGLDAALVQADVLAWNPAHPVDAVYEQTCMCALHPDHWTRYGDALHRWLRPDGLLLALFMQAPRPEASEGFIQGPPYHCDIQAMRAVFPASRWQWPKPPYPQVPHPSGMVELALALRALK